MTPNANDPLALELANATMRLANSRDKRFAQSLLDWHAGGKELTANQMYWAKTLIGRAGGSTADTEFAKSVSDDIFATESADQTTLTAAAEVPTTADMLNLANEAKLTQIIERVLGNTTQQLLVQNDERENNLARRQENFNKNAVRSIAQVCVTEALKRLDARVPRTVNIIVKRADGSSHTETGPQHPQYEELLRMVTLRKDDGYVPGIFLAGERGSGKTTGCKNVARALGCKWYANGAISADYQMLGFIDGSGSYHRTPFRDAYEFGGLYTFDEADRSDSNAVLAVNPHLANNEAAFPDGIVQRHKDCIITATGNTWGYGATLEFSGACKLDEAFLSRFEIKLPWDVDTNFEQKLVGNPDWYAHVQQARQRIRNAGIKYTIDSRAAIAGSKMITQLGYTHAQAAKQTYLASLKPDQRKIVEGLAA